MSETKLFGEPCCELAFDLLVRNGVATINIGNSLLNGCNEINPVCNQVDCGIVRKILNRFQNQFFLTHNRRLTTKAASEQQCALKFFRLWRRWRLRRSLGMRC